MKIFNKKRALVLVAVLLFALIMALPMLAMATNGDSRVEDAAGFFTESERQNLEKKLNDVSGKHGCDVVVFTCDSIGMREARDYALDHFFDVGRYSSNGLIMLITRDRDYAFCASSGMCEYAMTDDAYDLLEDVVVDELRDNNYYEACMKFADNCDEFMTAYESGEPYKKPEEPKDVGGMLGVAGVAAAGVGAATGAIGTGSMKSKLKTVHQKATATDYVKRGSLNVMAANEMYLYSNVIRTAIPRDEGRSGGGSYSHGFTSSSGHSGSGVSGKF